MKKKELMPTEENLINTLINDTIGRNKDIVDFLNILKCQEASCSIALNGKWGSGKTFFVRQTEMFINASSCLSQTDKDVKDKITSSVPIKNFLMTNLRYIMMRGKMIMIQIQSFLLFMR